MNTDKERAREILKSAVQQLPLAAPDQRSREVYRALLAQQQPVVTRSKKHGLEPGQDRGMGR
jgi:hypothetical protein